MHTMLFKKRLVGCNIHGAFLADGENWEIRKAYIHNSITEKRVNFVKHNIVIFQQICNVLMREALRVFLNAIIFSHINYCISSYPKRGLQH